MESQARLHLLRAAAVMSKAAVALDFAARSEAQCRLPQPSVSLIVAHRSAAAGLRQERDAIAATLASSRA